MLYRYTVAAGDTLTSIAARLGSDVEAIRLLNEIDNVNLIFAGSVIYVPVVDDWNPPAEEPPVEEPPVEEPPAVPGEYIWVDPEQLASLPTSGPHWDEIADAATSSWGTHSLADQDNGADVKTLAGALYAVRTGDAAMADKVRQACAAIVGTENGSGARTLSVARQLTGYVLAAELVGHRTTAFESWLAELLTKQLDGRGGIRTLRDSATKDPTNWGSHARSAVLASALYLDDIATFHDVAYAFQYWCGEDIPYDEFVGEWGDLSWQTNPSDPRGINPVSSDIRAGALPEEQRRSGPYRAGQPLPKQNYAWECLQGAFTTAHILARHGYPDVWQWGDSALNRAAFFLVETSDYPASGDDRFVDPLIDAAYGTSFWDGSPVGHGKSIGYTGWTHQPA